MSLFRQQSPQLMKYGGESWYQGGIHCCLFFKTRCAFFYARTVFERVWNIAQRLGRVRVRICEPVRCNGRGGIQKLRPTPHTYRNISLHSAQRNFTLRHYLFSLRINALDRGNNMNSKYCIKVAWFLKALCSLKTDHLATNFLKNIVASFITLLLTPLEQKLVHYSLPSRSLKFIQNPILGK